MISPIFKAYAFLHVLCHWKESILSHTAEFTFFSIIRLFHSNEFDALTWSSTTNIHRHWTFNFSFEQKIHFIGGSILQFGNFQRNSTNFIIFHIESIRIIDVTRCIFISSKKLPCRSGKLVRLLQNIEKKKCREKERESLQRNKQPYKQ